MKLSLTILTILFTFLVVGQEGRLKYANELLENKSYFYAAQAYEDVLERGIDSMSIASNIALAYDKTGDFMNALNWYEYIYTQGKCTDYQILRYVLLEKRAKNYTKAYETLTTYLSTKEPTEYELNLALNFGNFEKLAVADENFKVEKENINTHQSEIGISYKDSSTVIFSRNQRSRLMENQIHSWTGSYFYHLYKADVTESGKLNNVTPIKSNRKSKFHDGTGVYSPQYDVYFLTRNNAEQLKRRNRKDEDNSQIKLEIYTAKVENNALKNIRNLNRINSRKYSTCHPTLDTINNRLIFSSNQPGGYGGMDLYYVQLNKRGNIVGDPINFGPEINTQEDEVFPHFNSVERTLFFSTEGHYGLGGLDIFAAKLDTNFQTLKLRNLGAPVNSNQDDFSYVDNAFSQHGYFSSNRDGDDDIYSFTKLKEIFHTPLLNGKVYDGFTENTVSNAMVYLFNDKGVVIDSTYSSLTGSYNFKVEQNETYLIRTQKEGMKTDEELLLTDDSEYYTVNLHLNTTPNYLFAGRVIDQETEVDVPNVRIVLMDSTGNIKNYTYDSINGHFIIDNIRYQYGDDVDFTFVVSAPGYYTRYIPFKETLGDRQHLFLDNEYDVVLIKNENYEITDLFNLMPIYFNFDKHNIRPDAAEELDKIVVILNQHPDITLYLQAHTDTRGADYYNMWLSRKRAENSKKYLVAKGINPERLKIEFYGERKLYIPYKQIRDAKGIVEKERLHQLNRRVEFVISLQ
ncbi:OmpA family protein [Lishizhenia sp.]|uniref:OmpA family protein n=1 Tax=Lishizhenia sp. TaxID=2497594 RepID=UPI00299E0932|nr:OmpA family protein [Lishizhenia sp.]MDX1446883.1 OmpA family protein [Lishizhenia sp.]